MIKIKITITMKLKEILLFVVGSCDGSGSYRRILAACIYMGIRPVVWRVEF